MKQKINAIGLACPQPVMLAKKALAENNEITILVDNEIAVKNLEKLAKSMNAEFNYKNKNDNFEIEIIKDKNAADECEIFSNSNNIVICFKSDCMGSGNDELGRLLMKAYIHTIVESELKPTSMIFYNAGVHLVIKGADTADDIKKIQEAGVNVIICGTCANFYNIKDKVAVGAISNMYDISKILFDSAKVIYP